MKSISGYREFYLDGKSYFASARGKSAKKSVFTIELRFDLLGMAIEKLLMSILLKNGTLPDIHILGEMGKTVHAFSPLPEWVLQNLEAMDKHMHICSLNDYRRTEPTAAEFDSYLNAAEIIADMAAATVEGTAHVSDS